MTKDIKLEDVLKEYAIATPSGNDEKILREITEKYPQFRKHLYDFAAMRAVEKHTPEVEIPEVEMSKLQAKGLENLRSILNKKNAEEISSLNALAKSFGMKKRKFAEKLGINISILMYLEKRSVDYKSIPQTIIKRISETLKTTEDSVKMYLNQNPTLSGQVSYKSDSRPTEIKQKSFAEIIEEDVNLSPQEKQELLNLD